MHDVIRSTSGMNSPHRRWASASHAARCCSVPWAAAGPDQKASATKVASAKLDDRGNCDPATVKANVMINPRPFRIPRGDNDLARGTFRRGFTKTNLEFEWLRKHLPAGRTQSHWRIAIAARCLARCLRAGRLLPYAHV